MFKALRLFLVSIDMFNFYLWFTLMSGNVDDL